MPKIKSRTKTIVEEYVVLPYPERVWHEMYGKEPDPPGEVDITINKLVEIWEHRERNSPGFDSAYIGTFDKEERALEAKGWANGATRGGVWGTPKLKAWLKKHGRI